LYPLALLQHVVDLFQPGHRLRGHADALVLVRALSVDLGELRDASRPVSHLCILAIFDKDQKKCIPRSARPPDQSFRDVASLIHHMALGSNAQSSSLPDELALNCPAMTLAEGTGEERSTSCWKEGTRSLVHLELVRREGSWGSTGGKNTDSWMLRKEDPKPQSW
jgi:hypothetical protein